MINYYLAIDIGASSGRHILFWLEEGIMRMEEVYRFPNGMRLEKGHLCWDYPALESHILTGMKRCGELGKIPVSVGIDTWGVDFVLLNEHDEILGQTVGYRDSRTEGMDAEVAKFISAEALYARTGIQKAIYNTIYQLMAVKCTEPELLDEATTFLTVPDYFNWKLCGIKANEYTEATTTQLVDPETYDWDWELIDCLGYPKAMFRKILQPGSVLGELTATAAEQVGYCCQVVLPAAHDTASAIMAMPATEPDTVYISSGTWSLLGVELDHPDCGENSREMNFSNEGGYNRKICYLKNIMGLWMIQCVRDELAEKGIKLSFGQLCDLAEKARLDSTVDCNDNRFLAPESMIQEIRNACREKNQPVPETAGELANVVYRSLAVCYEKAVSQLRKCHGKDYRTLSILGGGSNADYLNRLTAAYTGCTVYAGPGEATAIGNAMAQMLCRGEFASLTEARSCVRRSFDVKQSNVSGGCA